MTLFKLHDSFPENVLPLEAAIWWRDNADLFLRCLTAAKYHRAGFNSHLSPNLIIYPPKCNIMENEMNGRKPSRNVAKPGNRNEQPLPFRWLNIALTSEDLNLLERETANLEQLALAFIQLGVLGLGLSIKYDNARKCYNVSIYGSDNANHMQPCGISGSSADLRDALLVSLYRFNSCLQGSFTGSTAEDSMVQPSRFK